MAALNHLCIGILTLQIYVYAAPSDISKLEEIANIETATDNLNFISAEQDNPSGIPLEEKNTNITETTRQKRFFNPFEYGFPPINPVIYPNFRRGDDFINNYGFEDPIAQIHRQVQEIAGLIRVTPGFPPLPIFFPVLFIPPFDCNCNLNSYQPDFQNGFPIDQPIDQSIDKPVDQPIDKPIDQPPNQLIDQPKYPMNQTGDRPVDPENPGEESPDITNTLPPMEDDKVNRDPSTNETGENSSRTPNEVKPEFTRPISFNSVMENQTTIRPPPPVEHGTVQSDATANSVPDSMVKDPPPSGTENSSPLPTASPQTGTTRRLATQGSPFNTQLPIYQDPYSVSSVPPPTPCDSAIIACCHQPVVVYDCFAIQGCPDITSYGNPCDTDEILRIIDRLQIYYANRNG